MYSIDEWQEILFVGPKYIIRCPQHNHHYQILFRVGKLTSHNHPNLRCRYQHPSSNSSWEWSKATWRTLLDKNINMLSNRGNPPQTRTNFVQYVAHKATSVFETGFSFIHSFTSYNYRSILKQPLDRILTTRLVQSLNNVDTWWFLTKHVWVNRK